MRVAAHSVAGFDPNQSSQASSTRSVSRSPEPKCRTARVAEEAIITTDQRIQNLAEDARAATG